MARTSVNIAVALILINGAAGFFIGSGIAADWGIQPSVGGDDSIGEAESTAKNIEASSGTGSTLLGLYQAVTSSFSSLIQIVFAGPTMLNNLGVPAFITAFIFGPLYLIVGADLIYVISGRVLT